MSLTLVPPFTPPLRGWLRVRRLTGVLFVKTMIKLFGGIQSRHIDLHWVDGMSLLLGACAERLETLQLYLHDHRGQQPHPHGTRALTNSFTARSYLWDSGLSQHRSLQTLEVMAWTINQFLGRRSAGPASRLLKHALSTITSPSFFKVVIHYQHVDFCGILGPLDGFNVRLFVPASQAEREDKALRYRSHLEAFRGCQEVRDFQLVLCATVLDGLGGYSMQVLKEAVAAERARGVFKSFSSEPVVIHSPRSALIFDAEELSGVWYYSPGLLPIWGLKRV